MKCKNCGAEIPDNAAFCDICGSQVLQIETKVVPARRPKPAKKNKTYEQNKIAKVFVIIGAISVAAVALIVIAAVISSLHNTYDKPDSLYEDVSEVPYRVTADMMSQIELGMTYDEVIAVIGGEGHKTYEYEDYVTYSWPGEYYNNDYSSDDAVIMYSELSLEFRGDDKRLWEIDEESIIDGQEIYNNKKEKKTALTTLSEEELGQIKEFMTYEEVRDILGTDGVLENSFTDIYEFTERKTRHYTWEYRKKNNGNEYNSTIYIYFTNGKVTDIYY